MSKSTYPKSTSVFLFLFLWMAISPVYANTVSSNLIPEGIYVIRCAGNSNYVLTLKNGQASNSNGIVISKWNNTNAQKWKVTHENNNTIAIRSMVNNKYAINVDDHQMSSGARIICWAFGNASNERWIPQKQSNGNYVLKVYENKNYALDVENGEYTNNNTVQLFELTAGANQQWKFERLDTSKK